jgi:hypothetical protein
VVIGNLDIEGVAALPTKANPVLVVDANAVLSCPVSLQRFKPVCRGRSKVPNLFGAVDLDQPAKSHFGDLLKSPAPASFKDRFCFFIAKRADQTSMVLRMALNVKQELMKIVRCRDRRGWHDARADVGGFYRRDAPLVLQNAVHDQVGVVEYRDAQAIENVGF